ncbi:hypothetical protein [Streptomyces regalis]|nr:hypothetical protein [Streptomyces regalis]
MTATTHRWTTPIGLEVTRLSEPLGPQRAEAELARLEDALDTRRGLLFSGRCDQPGRYRPHDLGHVDPPVEVTADQDGVRLRALNARGRVLLPALAAALAPHGAYWDEAAATVTATLRACVTSPVGRAASGTHARRVAEPPTWLRHEGAPAPCDRTHQTPR